jgi:hypothetical protein
MREKHSIDVVFEALTDAVADEEKVIHIDKMQRRSKAAPTSVNTPDAEDGEELKAACIKQIKLIYFRDGGEAIIEGILRRHGGGKKSFQDIPASKFGPIHEALAALGGE